MRIEFECERCKKKYSKGQIDKLKTDKSPCCGAIILQDWKFAQQESLTQSAGRNVQERVKAFQAWGDGYVTVKSPCSNLLNGTCKDGLPVVFGCSKGTICGFFKQNHVE